MTTAVRQILESFETLSAAEKRQAATEILRRMRPMDEDPSETATLNAVDELLDMNAEQSPLTEAQRQDLERRVMAYEANPKVGASWEEVKARLKERS